ncbi:MAG: S8 family serine peptidase [Deltaproteobacteria bacterium]|nr:S8 family serine peptidase [Deltaproteobacteria bacterium]
MPRPSHTLLVAALVLLAPAALHRRAQGADARPAGNDSYHRWLSREGTGAAALTAAHPSWDGRGVVIAVLDTGVDPSVPGLLTTSDGKPKILDLRDFSGEGDVELRRAERAEEGGVPVLRNAKGYVRGVAGLAPAQPAGGFWLGFLDESALTGSEVRDLDQDGDADGRFAILVADPLDAEGPVAWVDTDGDGDLADEEPRRSYADDPRWFALRSGDPRKDRPPVALAITVMPDHEPKVEVAFDDGGHGTHVAGIAAGFGIEGRAGFDGVAPGARILSLKIGDNTLSGGATTAGSMKSAIAFAGRWSDEHQTPVVINLSYGIGSEREGRSAIDDALTEALQAHPLLAACVAAGNDGPGLSTVGTPGGSARAFTVGALLLPDNAEALYGGRIASPRLFGFSSRGGELAKPDAVAPGVAWSTVPPFHEGSVMAGTSMATPQATGVFALLISSALQRQLSWSSGSVARALRGTARPVPGQGPLDQGAGLIRADLAAQALPKVAPGPSTPLGWDISTAIPHRPGADGSASFWRTGSYVPEYPHTIAVTMTPVFPDTTAASARGAAFTTLELRSDSRWARLDRTRVAVRGDQAQTIHISLRAKDLTEPGLHVATIEARADGQAFPVFSVPVAVVVPWRFTADSGRERGFDLSLGPAEYSRTFVEVPAGATHMTVRLEIPQDRFGLAWLDVYDPAGRALDIEQPTASSRDGRSARLVVGPDRLRPGIFEIDVETSLRNRETSAARLDVAFSALDAPETLSFPVTLEGGLSVTWPVTQRFDAAWRGSLEARLVGIRREHSVDVSGSTESETLTVAPGMASVRLRLSMEAEDYARFTDVAVDVLDASGAAVAQSGFGSRFLELDFPASPGDYTLRIVAATADKLRDLPADLAFSVEVSELQRLGAPQPASLSAPEAGRIVTLYPGVRTLMTLAIPGPLRALPSGYLHAVEVTGTRIGERWPILSQELGLEPLP